MAHILQVDWQETAEALHAQYRAEPTARVARRLHALWLLRQGGHTRDEVAALLGVSAQSVQNWLNRYRTGGVAAVRESPSGPRGGAPRRLTAAQEAHLVAEAGQGRFRHIDEVRQYVEQEWQVVYTYWGIRSVLDRLHIHSRVPRPQGDKADPEAQAAWKKGA